MGQSGVRNYTRLHLYQKLATSILEDRSNLEEVANLLVDVRFSEIPQAFADAIEAAAKLNVPYCGLASRFAHLMEYVAFVAFGTTERNAIPSWFLQNYECFLAACLHMLLAKYDTLVNIYPGYRDRTTERKSVLAQARRAFGIAFDLCAGAKNYLSLDCLSVSKGAHAALVVCNHSRYQFLRCIRPSDVFREFIDALAARIVDETEHWDVENTQLGFGYFASTRTWQNFAQSCMTTCTDSELASVPHLVRLQREVRCARKRPRSPEATEVAERPSTPTDSPTTALNAQTPPFKQRAIVSLPKASKPFLDLVKRIGVIDARVPIDCVSCIGRAA